MRLLLLFSVLCSAPGIFAQTNNREHDAHQHGHAELKLAWSGNQLLVELDTPAINLVGFEHPAIDEHDQHKLAQVIQQLKQARQLFTPDATADCELESVNIESSLLDQKPQHKENEINEGHDDHEISHNHSAPGHADFEVSIEYDCGSPELLNHVETSGFFKAFSGLEELDVEWISDNNQGAVELDASNSRIKLR